MINGKTCAPGDVVVSKEKCTRIIDKEGEKCAGEGGGHSAWCSYQCGKAMCAYCKH